MLQFSSSSSEMTAIFDRWRNLLLAAQSWLFDRTRRRHPIRFQDERRYHSRDNGSEEAGVAESFHISHCLARGKIQGLSPILPPTTTKTTCPFTIRAPNHGLKKRPQQDPRSVYGCSLCGIAICNHIKCWKEHLEAIPCM